MTILLYDYVELEEKASRHLRAWKGWHITLYVLAAVSGILNYTFLHAAEQLVDGNCVLYPRLLEFHMVARPELAGALDAAAAAPTAPVEEAADTSDNKTADATAPEIPEALDDDATDDEETVAVNNETIVIGNRTHRLALDATRTLFSREQHCQFAEYMPVVSTVFAMVWLTLFIMCPGGGRTRSGLQQPWRILAPALLFALVMVGLMGHSFTTTNGGIHAFCEAFHNVTNDTKCSPVGQFIERAWNSSVGVAGLTGATRAASAGAWASWACAAALLLARCLAAPDFVVKRTGVYLTRDPQQKLTPYLTRSPRRSQRSNRSSPTKRDTASVRSEPTATTEVVTASVEPGQDSAPSSLILTPARNRKSELLEMTHITPDLPVDSH